MGYGRSESVSPRLRALIDADGRFTLKGAGRGLSAGLSIRDPRFARQHLQVATDGPEGSKEVSQALEPAKVIEGRVTYADTGKPVPLALMRGTVGESEYGSMITTTFRADAEGRSRMNPTPGQLSRVAAYSPEGDPCLIVPEQFAWTRGAVRRELNLALPRGVLLRGTVAGAGTARPVADASVQFTPAGPAKGPAILGGW